MEADCGSDTCIHVEERIVDKTSMLKSQPHLYSISSPNVEKSTQERRSIIHRMRGILDPQLARLALMAYLSESDVWSAPLTVLPNA